jgi:hypothetical protein
MTRHRGSRRPLALTGVVAGACALTACGGALPPPNLHNIALIEHAIQTSLAAQSHLSGTAYCPTTVPQMKGEVFSCIVAVPRHPPVVFNVTELNNTGYVSYVER